MLALLFRHGVELTVPGPTNVSLEDAGDGALARIPPQGAVGSPWGALCTCPFLARDQPAPSIQPFCITELDAKQGQRTAVGLTGMWLFLSNTYVPV